MSKNFGLPYMGSKNRIAKEVITEVIWNEPNAQIFIDLFAGGCAMSHTALLSGKYKKVIANDINEMPKLFQDAILGKYRDEKRWISRDEFHKLKDTDMYVKSCWSFGNRGATYLYSKEIEPYKKAFWEFAVFKNAEPLKEFGFNIDELLDLPTSYERRIAFRQYLTKMPFIDKKGSHFYYKPSELKKYQGFNDNTMLDHLASLQRLERLQRLQRLERLEGLEGLENLSDILEISQGSYKDFKLPKTDECVIYCDIPYKGTQTYKHDGAKIEFDYEAFYNWVRDKAKQGYKIYISEYQMPSDFKEILTIEAQSLFSNKSPKKVKEKLFKYEN